MKNLNLIQSLKSFVLVSLLATMTYTQADDTEVFSTVNIANNLLFVLDVSGSMNNKVVTEVKQDGSTTSSGGVIMSPTYEVIDSKDDAWQDFKDNTTTPQEKQDAKGKQLEFRPGNIVATRFSFPRYSILRKGQYNQSYWQRWWRDIEINKIKVKKAYIKFKAIKTNTQKTTIKIQIENLLPPDADDRYRTTYAHKNRYYAEEFTAIKSRPYEGNEKTTLQDWSAGSTYKVDVASLINRVVNDSEWDQQVWWNKKYLSSLAFKIETLEGERVASSFEGGVAPELHIEEIQYEAKVLECDWWSCWWGNTRNISPSEIEFYNYETRGWEDAKSTIIATENNGYDDAVQGFQKAVSSTSYTDSEHVLKQDKVFALRFDLSNTPIPQGSVINEAYLQFTAAKGSTTKARINIQVEDSAKPLDFAVDPDIKGRTWENDPNGTQYIWDLPTTTPWSNGDTVKTGDLRKMVQLVVDKSDWGNVIAFQLFGELGDRVVKAQDSGNPPQLYVNFQDISSVGSGNSGGGTTEIRIEKRIVLLKEALREVMQTAPNVNVGLMKYSGLPDTWDYDENKRNHFVGGVLFPVSPIYEKADDYIGAFKSRDNLPDPGDKTVRNFLPDVADQWEPEGGTPIVGALYEAALYFRGEQMHYGKNKNNSGNAYDGAGSHPATFFGNREISRYVGNVGRSNIQDARYKSPMENECQSNFIVLMSDGGPTYYYQDRGGRDVEGPFARSRTDNSIRFSSRLSDEIGSCLTGNGENGNSAKKFPAGTCGREITQYLATTDQMPDTGRGNNKGLKGNQFVKTFTVGFGQGLADGAEEYLRSLATADGKGYYTADNKQELKAAFQNIFDSVAKSRGSLASPGYSVNVKNGLEHEDDIYIPVFDRKNSSRWNGNLKKFKLVDVNGKRHIRGKNDKDAVDETGGFSKEALDYWSKNTKADGLEIEKGGVAELIDPENRKVYTDASCTTINCALTDSDNKLEADNTAITNTMLGIESLQLRDSVKAVLRSRLINFTRGWEGGFYNKNANPKGIKRHFMGDMLHSEPVVITYKKGTGTDKKQYIFAGTNEGYLHAFDTNTGVEKFAFMPKELLKNVKPLFDNTGTYRDHKYGVDGSMTYWHDDVNSNHDVDNGEKVYLYFGLRRGGRSYYALDISDIDAPKLLWKKTSTDTGMSLLGQSWSVPYLAKVGIDGEDKPREVVIISGGYDKRDDRDKAGGRLELNDATTSVTANMGNNVYIIDAVTGELLWSLRESMGDTQLTHSIPGGMRILDTNGNSLIDRLYFADTGGDVWRLDLSEELKLTGDNLSVLTKFASLGGSSVNSRKFYNEPDVARLNLNGKTHFAISIGSGFRAHPKDKSIHDNMYVLMETHPFKPLPKTYKPIIHGDGNGDGNPDLASVTISGASGSLSLTQKDFDKAHRGWYLDLPETGEKVLANAVAFDGVINFTSLVPAIVTQGVDVCNAPTSSGRLYALNILTGKPGLNLDESKITKDEKKLLTDNDAYIKVVEGEITGTPQRVFNGMKKKKITINGKKDKIVCEHAVDLRVGKKLTQATGYDACRLESIYWNDPVEN